jgi:ribosomal protein S18 acetylase RimI-like enzyme
MPADVSHTQIVIRLLDEAARWLEGRGIRQWRPGAFDHRVTEGVARGEFYLAWQDSAVVGTFQVQSSDPRIWGADGDDDTALYLHSLAVAQSVHGKGIGCSLLSHAERLTAERGKSLLRLDCWAGNARLRAYYEAAGFTCVREAVEETWSCALFEKRVDN